jgi:hypothetical protein
VPEGPPLQSAPGHAQAPRGLVHIATALLHDAVELLPGHLLWIGMVVVGIAGRSGSKATRISMPGFTSLPATFTRLRSTWTPPSFKASRAARLDKSVRLAMS